MSAGGCTVVALGLCAAVAGSIIAHHRDDIQLSCKPADAPEGERFTKVTATYFALGYADDITVYEIRRDGEDFQLVRPRVIDRPSLCIIDRVRTRPVLNRLRSMLGVTA